MPSGQNPADSTKRWQNSNWPSTNQTTIISHMTSQGGVGYFSNEYRFSGRIQFTRHFSEFVVAKQIFVSSHKILWPNTFFNRKSALHSPILFARPEVVHRPTSHSALYFDSQNKYQIRMKQYNASTRRLPAAALLERWPQVCRVKITITLLPTNHFVFTTTNSMKCFVNWIPPENPRSFEKYPNPP